MISLTFHGDCEVDNGSACGDFWRESGIGELGGDVQPEVWVHVHFLITNFHLIKTI